MEKFLESSGIKLSATVTNLMGVSSRSMLEALVDGERDPQKLAALAKGSLRSKIPELVEALTGRFREHHTFIARLHVETIDALTGSIDKLTERSEQAMAPFRTAREFLTTIPGVSALVADTIVAETGADMSRFETPGRLVSWAGLSPGSNESAGRIKSTRARPGNPYLKASLGIAAMSIASRPKSSYLATRYKRIAARRGRMKAIIATQHSILAAWHMLADGECYQDPGADFFTQRDPAKAKNNAIKRLNTLGYQVTLTPTAAA